jgi:hypothetical protein
MTYRLPFRFQAIIASALFLFSLSALHPPATARADDDYAKLFGSYIEFIAVSQIKPVDEAAGGVGGHILTYIHGLCKDYSVNYPRVIPCSSLDSSQSIPHNGVAVSVNSGLKNANWVATPGHAFSLNGGLNPESRLDREAMERTLDRALELRVYEGIEMHEHAVPRQADPIAYQRALAYYSVGTDFALSLGRNVETVRVPLDSSLLPEIAEMLNASNERYRWGTDYEWSGLSNNCAHLTSRIAELAGLRSAIPQELPTYRQIFNLAVPANGIVTLRDQTQFANLDALFVWRNNSVMKRFITQKGILPIGGGILSRSIPVMAKNDYFKTDLTQLTLPPKPLMRSWEIYQNNRLSTRSKELTQLKESLVAWSKKLELAIQSANPKRCGNDRDCASFFARYQRLLRAKLEQNTRIAREAGCLNLLTPSSKK